MAQGSHWSNWCLVANRLLRSDAKLVGVVLLAIVGAFLPGCGCGGSDDGGDDGIAESPNDLEPRITAEPPAIPKNDSFKTNVTLDASGSKGPAGMTYEWTIGTGRLVSGTLTDPRIVVAFPGNDPAPVSVRAIAGSISNAASAIVRIDTPPIAVLQEDWTTEAGVPVTIDASRSRDRDKQPIAFGWKVKGGPDVAAASLKTDKAGVTSFVSDVPGDYDVELTLTAGELTTTAATTVHVVPAFADQHPVPVTCTATPAVAAVKAPVTIRMTLGESPRGRVTTSVRVGGKVVELNKNGIGTVTFDQPGDYPVVCDVTAYGRGGRARAPLSVFDPNVADNGPPQVSLTSPSDAQRIEKATNAIGTVSDSDLAAYYLEVREVTAKEDEPWNVLHKGTSPVNGGVLGPIERSLLREVDYILRLRAVDRRGNVASVTQRFTNDLASPKGPFSFVLVDYKANLSGPPMTVKRGYDSLSKVVGDFGYGWTMSTSGNGEIQQKNPLAEGWEFQGNCIFSGQVSETIDHSIHAKMGEERAVYAVQPQVRGCGTGYVSVALAFQQVGGRQTTLNVGGQGEDLFLVSGTLYTADDFTQKYLGNRVTLSAADQSSFSFLDGRMVAMRDRKGNGYDIHPEEIVHTSGAKIGFERDPATKLVTSVRREDGKQRTYAYNEAKELIVVTDFNGAKTRYFYGPDHVLSMIIGPRGLVDITAEYDENYRISSMNVVASGHKNGASTRSYDTAKHTQTTVGPDGATTVERWDDYGQLAEQTVNGESTFKTTVDGNGVPTGAAVAGRTFNITNAQPQSLSVVSGEHTLAFEYDANGHMTKANTPDAVMSYQRDAVGLPEVISVNNDVYKVERNDGSDQPTAFDMAGARFEFDHNNAGQINRAKFGGASYDYKLDSVGNMTGVKYKTSEGDDVEIDLQTDANGLPVGSKTTLNGTVITKSESKLAPDGEVEVDAQGTTMMRDRFGRPKQSISASGGVTSRKYDATGMVIGTESAEGASVDVSRDKTGATLVDVDGVIIRRQRDKEGRLLFEGVAGGPSRTNAYDAKGRLAVSSWSTGGTAKFVYDSRDNLSERRIGSFVERYAYDANRRLRSIQVNDLPPSTFSYDGLGNMVEAKSAGGIVQRRTFTGDRVTSIGYADGPPPLAIGYDAKGDINSLTDGLGHTRKTIVSKLGTVTTETRPSGAERLSIGQPDGLKTIDFDGRELFEERDTQGRLASVGVPGDDATKTTFSFDDDGRVIAMKDKTGTTSFVWRPAGDLLQETRPDGRFFRIDYGAQHNVVAVATRAGKVDFAYEKDVLKSVTPEGTPGVRVSYDPASRRDMGWTVGELEVKFVPRPDGRTATVAVTKAGAPVASVKYNYDLDGRPIEAVDDQGKGHQYTYDKAERLVSDRDIGGGGATTEIAYDNAFNVVRMGSDVMTYDVDDHLSRINGDAVTSDKAGRWTSKAGPGEEKTSYEWNALGRLERVRLPNGSSVEYVYDGKGLLVTRSVVGQSGRSNRHYLWRADSRMPHLIEDYDDKGNTNQYTKVGAITIQKSPERTYALVQDALGNVKFVFDATTGALLERRDYTAYGAPIGAVDPNVALGFHNHLYDPETGLYYIKQRWYDPKSGRFLSEDPVHVELAIPATVNRFQYGRCAPTVFIDPNGEFSLMGTMVSMMGYGNLQAMNTWQKIQVGSSILSQFAAIGLGVRAWNAADVFGKLNKNKNKSRWWSSIGVGWGAQAYGMGLGVSLGVEFLLHINTPSEKTRGVASAYGSHALPYITGQRAMKAASDAGVFDQDADGNYKNPDAVAALNAAMPLGSWTGGFIGALPGFGAGYSFYTNFTWDAVHPAAYPSPTASFSSLPVFVMAGFLIDAFMSLDLESFGVVAGATGGAIVARALLLQALPYLITAVATALIGEFPPPLQAPGTVVNPPGQPPGLTNAERQTLQLKEEMKKLNKDNFDKRIKSPFKHLLSSNMTLFWCPYESSTPLCRQVYDASGKELESKVGCVDSQTWGFAFDKLPHKEEGPGAWQSQGFNTFFAGPPPDGALVIGQYTFSMGECFGSVNGPGCKGTDWTEDRNLPLPGGGGQQ